MSGCSRIGVPICLLGVALGLTGCSTSPSSANADQRGQRRPLQYPVEVIQVEGRNVEYSVSAVGSIEAFERVQVTARVAGVVERVRFAEGDVAKEGQVLVEVEPERYRLAVEEARAGLQKAEVGQTDAETGLKRREALAKKDPGLMREEELAQYRTSLGVATAEVASRRAALALAELNLKYALVQAPVSGVIQTRTVQTGQYVPAGTALATLVRRDPLLLRFQVPDRDSKRLKPGMKASFVVGDTSRSYTAAITFVADFANETSRMVPVVARVEDEDREVLRPGAFAQVRIPIGTSSGAPVIPQTAVRPSERGFLAYVVEGEAARERILTLGLRTLDGLVEVRSGLQPGETLVVRGAEALRDGAPVKISEAPAPATAAEGQPKSAEAAEVRP
jgi:multidrug efflux system membrane fusion protein